MRIIIHIDLDAFYAAVEERDRPELKGKPIVVGADPKGGRGRGVVSACNYPARKFGIRSGMPISIAYRKCPDCIFLPVNMEKYIKVSNRIMRCFQKYSDKFEQASIDECYLDVSKKCSSYKAAIDLAKEIRQELKQKEKLTCSIGIGPNKLISKIAAGRQKPGGLTVVKRPRRFLDPLSVRELPGVGPKTESVLNARNIYKIRELRKIPKAQLVEWFGKFGSTLYDEARGVDESPVVEEWEAKSIARQVTFERDTKDKRLILETLTEMVNSVARQLKEEKLGYRTLTVKIRYEDFQTITKSKTLSSFKRDEKTAQLLARELLMPFLKDERKVRLIGFSVSKLKNF